jgi:hypothetical protein
MRPTARKLTLALHGLLIAPLGVIEVGCAGMISIHPSPGSGQIIRLPIVAQTVDIRTMDPATLADYSSYVPVSLIFPGLLTQDANGYAVP